MSKLRSTLVALGLTAALTGCSAGALEPDEATGDAEGQEVADDRVQRLARELAADLATVSWLEEERYLALQVPADAPTTNSGYPSASEHVRELLASSRTDVAGSPAFELVVRIRVHYVPEDDASGWDADPAGEATVARCFDYVVAPDTEVVADETTCPAGPPIPVDTALEVPDRPSVRPRDRAAVRSFLRAGSTADDVAALQARLSRGLTAAVEAFGRRTAVAVSARPDGTSCALGLRRRDGTVTVWHPDRMLTLPGEWGCVPSLAVAYPPGHVAGA